VPLPPVSPVFEDIDSPLEAVDDFDTGIALEPPVETAEVGEVAAEPVVSEPVVENPFRAAASEELQRAIDQTALRVERWMEDQRRRLGLGIDAMVASLKAQREAELTRIEEWKVGEQEKTERQLAEEKERFHAGLLKELVEFEHQLGERLREQEERLAKWWDEAEQLTKQRFAELGLSKSTEASDSPRA
jgi:hypothetical protein